jgi:DNA-binding SARP family transcriptional activator
MSTHRYTELEIRVLGDIELRGPHGTHAPGNSRPGAVLAMLAMHAGQIVSLDRLVDELWTAERATAGVKRVQVNVLRLRRALAQVAPSLDPAILVRTRSHGYCLEVDPDAIDAVRFARLIVRGRAELDAGDPARAAATLRDALALWRGEPYADFAYEPFAAAEIRRLQELRAYATELWAEAELALGEHALLAPELERLVARDPLRERLRALHMVALYRCRRQSEALAAYHAARRALVDELGIEPGSELRSLQRAILDQSPSLDFVVAAGTVVRAAAAPQRVLQAA